MGLYYEPDNAEANKPDNTIINEPKKCIDPDRPTNRITQRPNGLDNAKVHEPDNT